MYKDRKWSLTTYARYNNYTHTYTQFSYNSPASGTVGSTSSFASDSMSFTTAHSGDIIGPPFTPISKANEPAMYNSG